jgi:tRNA threonylcarbamoyladenosine biosynthesis protein TsaB
MIALALETSSARRSVALLRQSRETTPGEILGQVSEDGGRSTRPLSLVDALLAQTGVDRSQVERLVVGLGPGSYTGIRSAIAMTQGWQLARDVSATGVSTVECLAAQAHAKGWFGLVTLAIDAQRNEYYVASYEVSADGWQLQSPLRLVPRADVQAMGSASGALLIGPDVDRLSPEGRVLFPEAQSLFRCAPIERAQVGGEPLTPIYLREVSFVKAPPPRVVPD